MTCGTFVSLPAKVLGKHCQASSLGTMLKLPFTRSPLNEPLIFAFTCVPQWVGVHGAIGRGDGRRATYDRRAKGRRSGDPSREERSWVPRACRATRNLPVPDQRISSNNYCCQESDSGRLAGVIETLRDASFEPLMLAA